MERHHLQHPIGLLPFHLETGNDLVTVSGVKRAFPPRKRLNNQFISIGLLFERRSSRRNVLLHEAAHGVRTFLEVHILPPRSKQLSTPTTCSEVLFAAGVMPGMRA